MRTTFTISGDMLIQRRLPEAYEGRAEVADFIARGDARITNLETTLTRKDCFPSTFSGGTWLTADPDVLDDLKSFNFNLVSVANNHMMDYSYGGLFSTLKALRDAKLAFTGAGESLRKASEAAVIETKAGRVAFIALTSTFDDTARAGVQGPWLPARPGVNALRRKEVHYLTAEHFAQIQEIAEAALINVKNKRRFKTGYKLQSADGTFEFRDIPFALCAEGQPEGKKTFANAEDLKRTADDIKSLKNICDHVVVMLHSHEMKDDSMTSIDDFIIESAHAFIDAGASMVIGGGTHQLKGIEIYQGRPVFYSLGNFVYQNEAVTVLPPDFMAKYHIPYDTDPLAALAARRSHAKKGGMQSGENYLSVIPCVVMDETGLVSLEMKPISLGVTKSRSFKAIPYPANDEEQRQILKALQDLSAPFGTKLSLKDGLIRVEL